MRRATLFCSLSATLIGLAALLYDLYGPSYSGASSSCDSNGYCTSTTSTANLITVGLSSTALVFIIVVALLFLLVALAGVLFYARQVTLARLLLGLSLAALLLATVVSGLGIGYSFIPSDLLVVAALVFALRSPHLASPLPLAP